MNIFKHMANSIVESHAGRIRVISNGWEFGEGGTVNAQGVHYRSHHSKDGRLMRLTLNVLSTNNCPKPPGDYPVTSSGASVPMKVCRKCPHHIKRRRGQPYPCCAILRELRAKGPTPDETFAGMMKQAGEKAREMLGH